MNNVRDVAELYALANNCTRAKEGRRLRMEDAGAEVDSDDKKSVPASSNKGRKHNNNGKGKAVMVVGRSGKLNTSKKAKPDEPNKDVAACSGDTEATVSKKTDKPYCNIHLTIGHDINKCRQVE